MRINFFEHQNTIAKNLLVFIRERGFSKLSLSKLTNISRPLIDQILNSNVPNQTLYNTLVRKINKTFDLPFDYFLSLNKNSNVVLDHTDDEKPQKSLRAQELHDALNDILDIYSMYI
jgi:transcriptional regulator with XRE-family HTH domain